MTLYIVLQRRYELRRKDPERLSEEVPSADACM